MRIGYRFAFVGPLSGKDTAAGKAMTQAIQLYLDTVNQTGGIQGKKLFLIGLTIETM